jgi:Zn-dependent protease with chaperone function
LLAGVVITCVVVAIAHGVQDHNWPVVVMLSALPVLGLAAPLADAAISRHSERVADSYAAKAGAAPELAQALGAIHVLAGGSGIVARLLARHPDAGERIRVLRAIPLK